MIEIKKLYTGEVLFSLDAATLQGADLQEVELIEADLKNADLSQACWPAPLCAART
jgi:uncharacterized protein YjbI with pentapeptide repeats